MKTDARPDQGLLPLNVAKILKAVVEKENPMLARNQHDRSENNSIIALLQEVRYVIHTITFFAVFGSEKLHFPV